MKILGTFGWWSKAKFSEWSPVQTLLQYQRFFCQTIGPGYNQNIVGPTEFVHFVDSIQIKHQVILLAQSQHSWGVKLWDIFMLYGLNVKAACMGWALFNQCCYSFIMLS